MSEFNEDDEEMEVRFCFGTCPLILFQPILLTLRLRTAVGCPIRLESQLLVAGVVEAGLRHLLPEGLHQEGGDVDEANRQFQVFFKKYGLYYIRFTVFFC